MTRDLGIPTDTPAPPAATRAAGSTWRDPRLWIGILFVAGSVVAGARLLASVDDTVAVWALSEERGAGTDLSADDLVPQRVRFADEATLERYFTADRPLPDDLVLVRGLGAGELLARTAVGPAEEQDLLRVPLEVDPHRVPPDVETGSVVDVWLVDGAGPAADRTAAEEPALSGVTVVAAPSYDDTFAVTGARQLVVAVDDERAAAFEQLLGSLQDPVIRILQRS